QDAGWRVRNCGGIQSTAGVSRVTRPGTVPFETLLSGRDRIQSIRPNIRITATVEPTATVAWSLGRGGRSIPMQRDVCSGTCFAFSYQKCVRSPLCVLKRYRGWIRNGSPIAEGIVEHQA